MTKLWSAMEPVETHLVSYFSSFILKAFGYAVPISRLDKIQHSHPFVLFADETVVTIFVNNNNNNSK